MSSAATSRIPLALSSSSVRSSPVAAAARSPEPRVFIQLEPVLYLLPGVEEVVHERGVEALVRRDRGDVDLFHSLPRAFGRRPGGLRVGPNRPGLDRALLQAIDVGGEGGEGGEPGWGRRLPDRGDRSLDPSAEPDGGGALPF